MINIFEMSVIMERNVVRVIGFMKRDCVIVKKFFRCKFVIYVFGVKCSWFIAEFIGSVM